MSPLELFRRNQKVMMTGLILLAMFAFVVLPAVSEYMARSGPGMVDPVMAEFNGVSLTASRVNQFTRQHYQTVQFLRQLAMKTIERQGTPQVPGFSYDQQSNQIQSLGVNSSPSDDMSIRTLQFAAEAQQQGFALDDTSLENWIERFTAGTLSDREIYGLLQRESNNQMGRYQLFDVLRKLLLSDLFFRGSTATVTRGQFPLQSPLDHWKNFLKLNQQATINTYGVMVNDYLEQVDYSPSQAEIVAVYEEGKDRYPSEQSPEPGFRRRPTVTLEYLMADLQTFRDAEVETLSEQQIREEYERRKSGGAFQLPSEEPAAQTEATTTESPAPESPAPKMPAPETTTGDQQADAEMKKATTEKPAEEKPAEEKPAEEKPAEEKPAEDAGDDAETQTTQVKAFEKELAEAATLKLPAMETEATTEHAAGGEKKPAAENDQPAAVKETTEKETTEGGSPEGDAPADESSSEDQSAVDADNNGVRLVAMQADVSTEDADAAGETQAPAEAETATKAEPPAQTEQSTPAPSGDDPAATDAPASEEAPEPRYRPFDEVRDQVAQSMAENPARVALDQAISKARAEMKQYFSRRAIYESTPDPTGPPPERPDLQAIAKESGLEYRKIGPHTPVSLADEPIADSFEEGTALSQRGVPFTAMMFGVEGQVNKEALFRPVASVDLENQRTYLTWKIDETDAFTPELDEVRDEVVEAIRFEKARQIAQQAARSMADKVKEGGTLENLVPEDRNDQFYTDIGPFSWLNMVGFGNVTIGNVEELDSVGQEFMKAVFTAEEDQCVVAPNNPERVYYVINRTALQPATADLKALFMQQSERFMAMFMSDGTSSKVQEGFFDRIDAKTDFNRYELEE